MTEVIDPIDRLDSFFASNGSMAYRFEKEAVDTLYEYWSKVKNKIEILQKLVDEQHESLVSLMNEQDEIKETLEYKGKNDLKTLDELIDISQKSLREKIEVLHKIATMCDAKPECTFEDRNIQTCDKFPSLSFAIHWAKEALDG